MTALAATEQLLNSHPRTASALLQPPAVHPACFAPSGQPPLAHALPQVPPHIQAPGFKLFRPSPHLCNRQIAAAHEAQEVDGAAHRAEVGAAGLAVDEVEEKLPRGVGGYGAGRWEVGGWTRSEC
jgi:hypothetical protein